MKTKLTLTALIFTMWMNAQYVYVSSGADIRNGIFGSNATDKKPEFDLMFKFGMVGNNIEVVTGYEEFSRLDFKKYFLGVGYQIELNKSFMVIPMIEPTLIDRQGDWGGGLSGNNKSGHLSIGFSIPVRYAISDKISLEIQPNALLRTDDMAKYGGSTKIVVSNYLNVIYKLN